MTQTVLAVDTSHQIAVGLARGNDVLGCHTVADTRAHVEQLTPSIQAVLADAELTLDDIDLVVVGMGPGPFTGLRVGIVTGWTLASAADLAHHEVCSLDVISAQWSEPAEEYVVCSDARRHELYWARYVGGVRIGAPQVGAPDTLPDLPTIGPGVVHYRDLLGDRVTEGPDLLDPAVMAVVGPRLDDAGREALYLRRPDAAVPTRRKSALPTGPRLLRGLTPRSGATGQGEHR